MPGLKIVYLTIHDYYFVVDNFRLLHFLHPFLMHVNFFPFVRFELRYPIIYSRETLRYTHSIYHNRQFFLHAT